MSELTERVKVFNHNAARGLEPEFIETAALINDLESRIASLEESLKESKEDNEMLEYEKSVIQQVAFPNLKFVKDGKPITPPKVKA